jgi:hypothetical protein
LATGKRTEPAIEPPAFLNAVWNAFSERHRGADHVGRLGDHHRGGGVHHHHEFLRLGRHVAAGHRVGRQHVAGQDVDVVAHHQLLRQALGDVGGGAADVLGDQLDLAPGDRVAVHLHVGARAVQHLAGGIGELPGQRERHADLDRLLCKHRRGDGKRRHHRQHLVHRPSS